NRDGQPRPRTCARGAAPRPSRRNISDRAARPRPRDHARGLGVSTAVYLADKSAHAQRYASEEAARRLDREIAAGRLAVCEMVALELLYSARNSSDSLRLGTALEALPWAATDGAAMKRALDVQRQLARRGQHRRPL